VKKLHLLLGTMILSIASVNAAQRLTEEQRAKLEVVHMKKAKRQRKLARPSVYKMVDAAIKEYGIQLADHYAGEQGEEVLIARPIIINWPAVFSILDSMRRVISVNEYRTFEHNFPLLYIAIKEGDISKAKTLLEKYKANPNALVFELPYRMADLDDDTKDITLLEVARKQRDNEMVNLLLKYGAKEE